MELEEEQAYSKQARTVPKSLINTLMDCKLLFPLQGKTWSTNQQAELQYVHCALIADICDEKPFSLADALAHDHWIEVMKLELESIHKNNT